MRKSGIGKEQRLLECEKEWKLLEFVTGSGITFDKEWRLLQSDTYRIEIVTLD